jgi:GDP-6-deoxy-D-talose 4-dehydrogenase
MTEHRALITGINGFTGHYLAAELEAAGYQVFGTSREPDASARNTYTADVCDRARLGAVVAEVRPTLVAHLAAIAFVAHGDADAIYRTNVIGTRHLLEAIAALDDPPKAVLIASSANVYGNSLVHVIDETAPFAPANDYAVSKLAAEYVARLWMDRLPIVITRPFNYSGVGQAEQFLLPKIVSHFRRGLPEIALGNTDVARDFSDVRMVATAYRRLLEAAPAGEVFNICSGTAYTLSEVLQMMASIAGYKINVTVNPAFVRSNEVKRLLGSKHKLVDCIGPLPDMPLEQTLEWMYRA